MTNSAGVERLRRLVGGAVLALDGNVGAVRDFYGYPPVLVLSPIEQARSSPRASR